MIRGTVVGQVWATRKARGLDGQTLLLVAARDAEGIPAGGWSSPPTCSTRAPATR